MAIQQTNGTQDVLALLTALKGQKSSQTTQSNISTAGANELVNSVLRSNQGLAAVASGAKGAGVYNSSTNQLLINDLMTSTAAKVEAMRAGQTTTNRTAPQVTGKEILAVMALMKSKGVAAKLKQQWDSSQMGDVNMSAQDPGSWQSAGGNFGNGLNGNLTGADGTFGSSFVSYLSDGTNDAAVQEVADLLNTGSNSMSWNPDVSGSYQGMNLGGTAQITSAVGDGEGLSTGFDSAASGLGRTSDAASVSSAGASAASSTDMLGGSGSNIGYVGSLLEGYNASRTDNDYRKAVGSGILNWFGWGAATPFVAPVAEKLTDDVMDNAYEDNGVGGALMADPASTILSGRYNDKDTFTSGLDPMNLFGGNPGGSVEGFLGQVLDPLGSIFGW